MFKTILRNFFILNLLALPGTIHAVGDDFDLPFKGDEWLNESCLKDAKKSYAKYQKDYQKIKTDIDSETKETELFSKKVEEAKKFAEDKKAAFDDLDLKFRSGKITYKAYETGAKALVAPLNAAYENPLGSTVCDSEIGGVPCTLVRDGWNREISYSFGTIFITSKHMTLSTPEKDKAIIASYQSTLKSWGPELITSRTAQINKDEQDAIKACDGSKECISKAQTQASKDKQRVLEFATSNSAGFSAVISNPNHPNRAHTQNVYWSQAVPIGEAFALYNYNKQGTGSLIPKEIPADISWNDYALDIARRDESCLSEKVTKLRTELAHNEELFNAQKAALSKEICRLEQNAQVLENSLAMSKLARESLIRIKQQLNTTEFDEAIKRIDEISVPADSTKYCTEVTQDSSTKAVAPQNTDTLKSDASDKSVTVQ